MLFSDLCSHCLQSLNAPTHSASGSPFIKFFQRPGTMQMHTKHEVLGSLGELTQVSLRIMFQMHPTPSSEEKQNVFRLQGCCPFTQNLLPHLTPGSPLCPGFLPLAFQWTPRPSAQRQPVVILFIHWLPSPQSMLVQGPSLPSSAMSSHTSGSQKLSVNIY